VTVANSKKFTGYERDNNSSATGLDYSMFRYHSSYWGRFQTPDPYDGSYDLSNPQSFNRYSYVQNDPVNLVDPLGLNPIIGGHIAGALTGILTQRYEVTIYGSTNSSLIGGILGGGVPEVELLLDDSGSGGGVGGGDGGQGDKEKNPSTPVIITGKTQKCKELEDRIRRLTDELKNKRHPDLLINPRGLPLYGPKDSVESHIFQYHDVQTGLQRLIEQWHKNGCGDSGQGGDWRLINEAYLWSYQPTPINIGVGRHPRVSVTPGQAAAGAGAVVGGYLLYRAIRMLPSLIPALWWTIPANAAAP